MRKDRTMPKDPTKAQDPVTVEALRRLFGPPRCLMCGDEIPRTDDHPTHYCSVMCYEMALDGHRPTYWDKAQSRALARGYLDETDG